MSEFADYRDEAGITRLRAVGGGAQARRVRLTDAEIIAWPDAGHTNGYVIVPAPGAGSALVLHAVYFRSLIATAYVFGGDPGNPASQPRGFYYWDGGDDWNGVPATAQMGQSLATQIFEAGLGANEQFATLNPIDAGDLNHDYEISVGISPGAITGGDAANTLSITAVYSVFEV